MPTDHNRLQHAWEVGSTAPQRKARVGFAPNDAETDEGLLGWLLSCAAACGGIDPVALGHRQLCTSGMSNFHNYKRQQQQHKEEEELHRRYHYTYSGVCEEYPYPPAPALAARGDEGRPTTNNNNNNNMLSPSSPPPSSSALGLTSVEAVGASHTEVNPYNNNRTTIIPHHRLDPVMRFDDEGFDENVESGDDHENHENEGGGLRANNVGVGGENGLLLERSVQHHFTSSSTSHLSPIRLIGENNDQQDEHPAGVEDNALTPTLPHQHGGGPRRPNNDGNTHVASEPERPTVSGLTTSPQTMGTRTRLESTSTPQTSSQARREGGYLASLFRQLETTGSVRRVRGGTDGNAVITIVQNTPERAPPRMVNGIPMSMRKTDGGGYMDGGSDETSSLSHNGIPPFLKDEKGNMVTHEYL